MDIAASLRAIVSKHLEAGKSFDDESRMADIGLDSLDMIEISFEIEDELRVKLPQVSEKSADMSFADFCRLVEDSKNNPR